MTLPNPALGFPLKEGQSGRIYPSEIKRRKEKEPMGASRRKDCISSREPQDGHTGQQTSNTDSLHSRTPTLEREISHMFLGVFFATVWVTRRIYISSARCVCFSATFICISSLFCHMNANTRTLTYMHTYSSHSYLYDTGLGGMPVRCEECDGDHTEPWPLSTNYSTIWPSPNLPLKTPGLEMMQKTAGCPLGHTS